MSDAAAAVGVRRLVIERRPVLVAWLLGWADLVRRPQRVLPTALVGVAVLLLRRASRGSLAAALGWGRVRDVVLAGRDPSPRLAIALVIWVGVWLGALVLGGVAAGVPERGVDAGAAAPAGPRRMTRITPSPCVTDAMFRASSAWPGPPRRACYTAVRRVPRGAPCPAGRPHASRMDQILDTIGDTIGGFFANPIVQLAIQAVAIYFVILWLASAYWAFRDMQLRSENPVLPYLAAALIILFTPGPVPRSGDRLPHRPPAGEDRRGLRAEPRGGGPPRRGRDDQDLSVLLPARERGMDHLPHLPHAAQPRVRELRPPRRPRLVAVRLVRQGLRARRPRVV